LRETGATGDRWDGQEGDPTMPDPISSVSYRDTSWADPDAERELHDHVTKQIDGEAWGVCSLHWSVELAPRPSRRLAEREGHRGGKTLGSQT
jgi:hypothetical protein